MCHSWGEPISYLIWSTTCTTTAPKLLWVILILTHEATTRTQNSYATLSLKTRSFPFLSVKLITFDSELDLCIFDSNNIVRDFWKSDVRFSDGHDMITVTINSSLTPPEPKDFNFRDYKAVDENALCNYLDSCDLFVFNSSHSLETFLECFYKNQGQAVQISVLVKKVFNAGSPRPWFTHELDLLNHEKDRWYRRYDITRRRSDWNRFRIASDRAQEATEEAKLLFYHERLKDLHDSKQIWKQLKNLGLCENGVDSPSKYSSEELNVHYSRVSLDSHAPSTVDCLEWISIR